MNSNSRTTIQRVALGAYEKRTWIIAMLVLGFGGSPAGAQPKANELPAGALLQIQPRESSIDGNGIYKLRFSPSGTYLAARDRSQIVTVYETARGRKVSQLSGHNDIISDMKFCTDQRLVTSDIAKSIILWNTISGEQLAKRPKGANKLSIDRSQRAVVVARGEEVFWHDLESLRLLKSHQWSSRGGRVSAIALSDSGRKLVARHGSDIHDLASRSSVSLQGMTHPPYAVAAFSDNDLLFVSAKHDDSLGLWKLANRELPANRIDLTGNSRRILSLAISPDNRFIAAAGADRTIRLWEVLSEQLVAQWRAHQANICALAFSPDGRQLASGASGLDDCSVIIWDWREHFLFDQHNPPTSGTPYDFAKLLEGLSAEPASAMKAVSQMVRNQSATLPLINEHVAKNTSTFDPVEIERLVGRLNDRDYEIRETAHQLLMRRRSSAAVTLRRFLQSNLPIETRIRIHSILQLPSDAPKISHSEFKQLCRLVFALELIGNPDAKRLLQRLADGHTHAEVARQAAESLERLN